MVEKVVSPVSLVVGQVGLRLGRLVRVQSGPSRRAAVRGPVGGLHLFARILRVVRVAN